MKLKEEPPRISSLDTSVVNLELKTVRLVVVALNYLFVVHDTMVFVLYMLLFLCFCFAHYVRIIWLCEVGDDFFMSRWYVRFLFLGVTQVFAAV